MALGNSALTGNSNPKAIISASANGSISFSSYAHAFFAPLPIKPQEEKKGNPLNPTFQKGFPTTWDSNPSKTFEAYRIGPQIRGFHHTKLQHMGHNAELWQPVSEGLVCSCVKETMQSAQRDCPSCYGTGYVPGFLKFLHKTWFFDVAEADDFQELNQIKVEKSQKPHKLVIEDGFNEGTFITNIKDFDNGPIPQDWQVDLRFKKPNGGIVQIEFTTDGNKFVPITQINGPNKPVGNGMIQLRVTLKRVSPKDRSPEFHIARIRRLAYENINFPLTKSRECTRYPLNPGNILVLWDWQQTTPVSSESLGIVREEIKRIWTAPLDFFDTSIEMDTPEAAIFDLKNGPHPFIKFSTGIEKDHIFVLTKSAYSEQLQIFTHQSFQARKPQRDSEVYNVVNDGCSFVFGPVDPIKVTGLQLYNQTELNGTSNGSVIIKGSAVGTSQLNAEVD